jgi:hypothetical protein
MSFAKTLVYLGEAYLALGLCAAAAFLAFGLSRVSASARGAYAFRVLIVPGLVLLWPHVLFRWRGLALHGEEGFRRPNLPRQRQAHAVVWRAAVVLVPALLVAFQALRPRETLDLAPIRLSPPAEAGR